MHIAAVRSIDVATVATLRPVRELEMVGASSPPMTGANLTISIDVPDLNRSPRTVSPLRICPAELHGS